MKTQLYITAGIISGVCIVFILLHLGWPRLAIDQTMIILLALAVLPWLIPFFTKIKFGPIEGDVGTFRHGETRKPPTPELAVETKEPNELSKDAKRILVTLWKHQTKNFKDDFTRRWSFRVLPPSEAYGSFMIGFAELLRSGIVSWTHKDGQAVLTDKGIEYVKKYPELQESDDIYRF